jgi:outer membrane lipoprotein-sorting protein
MSLILFFEDTVLKQKKIPALYCLLFILILHYNPVRAQDRRKIELNAQALLAKVDRLPEYPRGELQGSLNFRNSSGETLRVQLRGSISKGNYLFIISDRKRGDVEKVLYNRSGEEIRVFKINSLKTYSISGINRFDPVVSTGFNYIDLSHADFQSSYNAAITGSGKIKNKDVYRLELKPVYRYGNYSKLILSVSKNGFHPVKIEYFDEDGARFKSMNISKIKKFGKKLFPTRYEMINSRERTITVLSFHTCDSSYKFEKSIFRPESLK